MIYDSSDDGNVVPDVMVTMQHQDDERGRIFDELCGEDQWEDYDSRELAKGILAVANTVENLPGSQTPVVGL
jgi:hypothetical protein